MAEVRADRLNVDPTTGDYIIGIPAEFMTDWALILGIGLATVPEKAGKVALRIKPAMLGQISGMIQRRAAKGGKWAKMAKWLGKVGAERKVALPGKLAGRIGRKATALRALTKAEPAVKPKAGLARLAFEAGAEPTSAKVAEEAFERTEKAVRQLSPGFWKRTGIDLTDIEKVRAAQAAEYFPRYMSGDPEAAAKIRQFVGANPDIERAAAALYKGEAGVTAARAAGGIPDPAMTALTERKLERALARQEARIGKVTARGVAERGKKTVGLIEGEKAAREAAEQARRARAGELAKLTRKKQAAELKLGKRVKGRAQKIWDVEAGRYVEELAAAKPPAPPKSVLGADIAARKVRAPSKPGTTLVEVDVAKLDDAWKADPRDVRLWSESPAKAVGRRKKYIEWLQKNPGKAINAPEASLKGGFGFQDGRNRFAVLRDAGVETTQVAVPKGEIAEFQRRFGPKRRVFPPKPRVAAGPLAAFERAVDPALAAERAAKAVEQGAPLGAIKADLYRAFGKEGYAQALHEAKTVGQLRAQIRALQRRTTDRGLKKTLGKITAAYDRKFGKLDVTLASREAKRLARLTETKGFQRTQALIPELIEAKAKAPAHITRKFTPEATQWFGEASMRGKPEAVSRPIHALSGSTFERTFTDRRTGRSLFLDEIDEVLERTLVDSDFAKKHPTWAHMAKQADKARGPVGIRQTVLGKERMPLVSYVYDDLDNAPKLLDTSINRAIMDAEQSGFVRELAKVGSQGAPEGWVHAKRIATPAKPNPALNRVLKEVGDVYVPPELAKELKRRAANLTPESPLRQFTRIRDAIKAGSAPGGPKGWTHVKKLISKEKPNPAMKELVNQIGDMYFPPDVMDELKRTVTNLTSASAQKWFVRKYDKALGAWKYSVTAPFPAFHARNVTSNMVMIVGNGVRAESPIILDSTRYITRKGSIKLGRTSMSAKKFGRKMKAWRISGGLGREVAGTLGATDEAFRGGYAADRLREAMTKWGDELTPKHWQFARDQVNKTLGNYRDIGKTGKFIQRTVLPFWKWTRHSVPQHVEWLFTKPYMLNAEAKAARMTGQWVKRRAGTILGTGNPLEETADFVDMAKDIVSGRRAEAWRKGAWKFTPPIGELAKGIAAFARGGKPTRAPRGAEYMPESWKRVFGIREADGQIVMPEHSKSFAKMLRLFNEVRKHYAKEKWTEAWIQSLTGMAKSDATQAEDDLSRLYDELEDVMRTLRKKRLTKPGFRGLELPTREARRAPEYRHYLQVQRDLRRIRAILKRERSARRQARPLPQSAPRRPLPQSR
jgi:hypothetical protein